MYLAFNSKIVALSTLRPYTSSLAVPTTPPHCIGSSLLNSGFWASIRVVLLRKLAEYSKVKDIKPRFNDVRVLPKLQGRLIFLSVTDPLR
jgi:hypothetical protein